MVLKLSDPAMDTTFPSSDGVRPLHPMSLTRLARLSNSSNEDLQINYGSSADRKENINMSSKSVDLFHNPDLQMVQTFFPDLPSENMRCHSLERSPEYPSDSIKSDQMTSWINSSAGGWAPLRFPQQNHENQTASYAQHHPSSQTYADPLQHHHLQDETDLPPVPDFGAISMNAPTPSSDHYGTPNSDYANQIVDVTGLTTSLTPSPAPASWMMPQEDALQQERHENNAQDATGYDACSVTAGECHGQADHVKK
jgi:hypothetical protein